MKKSHEDLLSRPDSLELCFLLTIFARSENELEFNFVLTTLKFSLQILYLLKTFIKRFLWENTLHKQAVHLRNHNQEYLCCRLSLSLDFVTNKLLLPNLHS